MHRLPAALCVLGLAVLGCGRDVVPPPEFTIPAFVPPLHDAATGERLVTRRGAQEWEYTVVSAGDVDVVVEVLTTVDGAPQGRPQRFTWNRNRFGLPDLDVVRRVEAGRLEVGGRTWDCWILHVDNRQRGRFYYWISDEVAVHGVLKIAKSDGGAPEEATSIAWVADSLSGHDVR